MQFVNDDMDELMRRAADQLPLKPAGADWDAVASKLNTVPRQDQSNHSGSKGFFLLGAFLLASLVCNDFYRFTFGDRLLSAAAMIPADRGQTGDKKNQRQPATNVSSLRQDGQQKELCKPVSIVPNEMALYPSHPQTTSYKTKFVKPIEVKNI